MVLPGIIPRVKELHDSGFGWVAHMMAIIYASVRLLPPNHPYLSPSNIGRFGIRHVIGAAAGNLIIKKENIDQILIFFSLLAAFIILLMQFFLLILGFVIQPVLAGGGGASGGISIAGGMFSTADPENDIAFMMLDKVFAVPSMFGSKFDAGVTGISPFNTGLHALFEFYNTAILLVGVIVFLYYIFIIVGETAQTGTPFGKRFNHVWGPIRLIVAIGLLIPLNYGYNSAQYITLYAAKIGSGFATNGWHLFNETLTNPSSVDDNNLIIKPKQAEIGGVVRFMSIVQACRAMADLMSNAEDEPDIAVKPYLLYAADDGAGGSVTQRAELTGTGYAAALSNFNNRDIQITFGQFSSKFTEPQGNVRPECGKLTINITNSENVEAQTIQEGYYNLIIDMWNHGGLTSFGQRAAAIYLSEHPEHDSPCNISVDGEDADHCKNDTILGERLPDDAFKTTVINHFTSEMITITREGREAKVEEITGSGLGDEIKAYGWGGAGIWYNSIAEWNGSLISSLLAIPAPQKMPRIMELVKEERTKNDNEIDLKHLYDPMLSDGKKSVIENDKDREVASALNNVYLLWTATESEKDTDRTTSANMIIDMLSMMFGVQGLFSMRENKETHPLAQLVGLGKSIMDAAIRNVMIGIGASIGGGMMEILRPQQGGQNFLQGVALLAKSFATATLSIGFILYYVLPFMPFMYFFFGVGNWVKGIFEAMVGVPLWALAHLRIDGNGLPGDSASNGYFLILEIFIRPILMIFGLIASIVIFTAQVRVLNAIFDIVTSNLTGFDCWEVSECEADRVDDSVISTVTGIDYIDLRRNVIDEFFFTVLYALLVYMLATSSFKLIDSIPRSIIRWMGASVQSFNDQQEDPAKGLAQYVAFGGSGIARQAVGALDQGAKTGGMVLGSLIPNQRADRTGNTGRTNTGPAGSGTVGT